MGGRGGRAGGEERAHPRLLLPCRRVTLRLCSRRLAPLPSLARGDRQGPACIGGGSRALQCHGVEGQRKGRQPPHPRGGGRAPAGDSGCIPAGRYPAAPGGSWAMGSLLVLTPQRGGLGRPGLGALVGLVCLSPIAENCVLPANHASWR